MFIRTLLSVFVAISALALVAPAQALPIGSQTTAVGDGERDTLIINVGTRGYHRNRGYYGDYGYVQDRKVHAPYTYVAPSRGKVVVDAPYAYVKRSRRGGVRVRAPFVDVYVP